MTNPNPVHAKIAGTAVIWPSGVRARYGIGPTTLFRWERDGILPPRDFSIGGKSGWQPQTLAAAERSGDQVAKRRRRRAAKV